MRHKLLAVVSGLSLVLCLGIGAVIARSYWVCDQWNRFRGTEFRSVEVEQGHLFLVRGRGEVDQGEYDTYRPRTAVRSLRAPWSIYESGLAETKLYAGGLYAGARSGSVTLSHHRVSLWWVAALAAVLPARLALRRLRSGTAVAGKV